MTENPSATPPDPAALAARVAALEAELERVKFERDNLKSFVYPIVDQQFPDEPPTPEELHEMMHTPRGPSFAEIVDEFEARTGRHDS